MDAAAAESSQPRVPDSRLPGAEASTGLGLEEAGQKEAATRPASAEAEAEDLKDDGYEFSALALWPVFLIFTFFITVIICTAWYGPKRVLQRILQYLVPARPQIWHAFAIWGAIVACIVLAIPILLLLLPVPALMFGFWKGILITFLAEIVGAALSFVIGRYVAQRRVRRFLEGKGCKRVMRLLHVLEDDEQQSMQLLILYRFLTIPMAVRNYGPSVLRVPMEKLVLSSIPHSLWSALVFATAGSALQGTAQLLRDGHQITWRTPQWQQILGLVMAFLSFALFSWIAWRAYARKVEAEEKRQAVLIVEGADAANYGATTDDASVQIHTSGS